MIPYGKHQAKDRNLQQNLARAGAAISHDRLVGEVKEEKRGAQREKTSFNDML